MAPETKESFASLGVLVRLWEGKDASMTEAREGLFWDVVAGKAPLPPAAKLLGWKALHVEPGHVRVEYTAREDFYNPVGSVQGGMLAAMLDETMGPAAVTLMGPNEITTTLEMKISFIRPATAGKLVAEGRVVHKGRSVVFMEGSLSTEDESLVATATATARIVPFQAGASGGER